MLGKLVAIAGNARPTVALKESSAVLVADQFLSSRKDGGGARLKADDTRQALPTEGSPILSNHVPDRHALVV